MINTQSNEYLNFKKIKSQVDVRLILGQLGLLDGLKDRGDELVGHCPLGKEPHGKSTSFSFNTEKKAFQCFSCRKSGSILDFFVLFEQRNGEHSCTLRDAALWVKNAMENADTSLDSNPMEYQEPEKLTEYAPTEVAESPYLAHNARQASTDDAEIIDRALQIIQKRFDRGDPLIRPEMVKQFLQLHLSPLKHERLVALFLDAKHQLISMEDIANGSPSQSKVSCNFLLRLAIEHGADAVILAHNHPSGEITPSKSDECLTSDIKTALEFIQVRLLDHIVVGKDTLSFAEHGLI